MQAYTIPSSNHKQSGTVCYTRVYRSERFARGLLKQKSFTRKPTQRICLVLCVCGCVEKKLSSCAVDRSVFN